MILLLLFIFDDLSEEFKREEEEGAVVVVDTDVGLDVGVCVIRAVCGGVCEDVYGGVELDVSVGLDVCVFECESVGADADVGAII